MRCSDRASRSKTSAVTAMARSDDVTIGGRAGQGQRMNQRRHAGQVKMSREKDAAFLAACEFTRETS
jgi:hypothetical protein